MFEVNKKQIEIIFEKRVMIACFGSRGLDDSVHMVFHLGMSDPLRSQGFYFPGVASRLRDPLVTCPVIRIDHCPIVFPIVFRLIERTATTAGTS